LIVYAMSGSVDGEAGDHIMISPPLTITSAEIDEILELLRSTLDAIFSRIK